MCRGIVVIFTRLKVALLGSPELFLNLHVKNKTHIIFLAYHDFFLAN